MHIVGLTRCGLLLQTAAWSVCMLIMTDMSPAKTDKPIKVAV